VSGEKAEGQRPGIGVDASGGPLIDPTQNVKDLTDAAVQRLDDLRNAESRRIDELRIAESRRVDEQAQLRADYSDKLANAEAKRIDAIRAVDVNAVAVATSKQADQATVLANQVAQSAEALRALVASTAATTQAAFQQAMTSFSDRLMKVEQAQYASAGQGQGAKNLSGYLIAATVFVFGFIGMVIAVIGVVVLLKK
jgi:hypothetical protein